MSAREAEPRTEMIRFRITPTTRKRLHALRLPGENTSDTLRRLIETGWESK